MTDNGTVRILIADDHEIVRQGIRSLFDLQTDWEICGEAVDGLDAIEKSKHLQPDVILLDVSMPHLNGLDAARIIRKEVPHSKILMVSQHDGAYMSQRAMEVGARGYVAKSELSRQLLAAVESVIHEGKPPAAGSDKPAQKLPQKSKIDEPGVASRVTTPQPKESVEEIRSRLAAIVESSDDAIVSKDFNGIITSWNASAERMFGYTEREAVGQPITLIIPPELQDEERQILQRLRSGERIDHFETERQRKDGKRITVSLTISPVEDASGRIVGASKTARDVTHLGQVEMALRESEQRLRFSLEAANFGTWNWDIRSGNVQWSENMERIHGQSAGSFAGDFDSFIRCIREEDRDAVQKAVQGALSGDGKYHTEYRQVREDGTTAWMEARGQVIRDDSGHPVRMMGVCMDISERKKAEQALKQAREELELRVTDRTVELERAQERLRALSGRLLRMQDDERRRIARELHDTAGQMLVGLNLNLVPLEEELAKSHSDLVKPVKECLGLVDELSRDLRTISHLLHPPLLDEAGLPSALRWYVEGFSERSKVDVELHLAEDLGRLPAECETAIFRMVQECLTNIHRHSESATASISITHDAQNLKVEIRDQGKGMPIPIPRAGVGIQGMGERIRQLGGSLEIESGGHGTSVIAILPANLVSPDAGVATADVA